MTTIKKIILFLFGIVLIVFGNKAAIDTIFKTDEGLKAPDSEEKDIETKKPVITEDIEQKEIEDVISTPKVEEAKKVKEVSKKETPKTPKSAPAEKVVKEQPEPSAKKEEVEIKEAPKTTIEPVQEESAAASE